MKRLFLFLFLVFGALAFRTLPAYLPYEPKESLSSSTFTEPNWQVPTERTTVGHSRADKFSPTIANISYRLSCISPKTVSHGTPILQFDLRNGQARERTFHLAFSRAHGLVLLNRTIEVGPNGEVHLALPLFRTNSNDYGTTFNRLTLEETTPGVPHYTETVSLFAGPFNALFRDSPTPAILMANDLSPESFSQTLGKIQKESLAKRRAKQGKKVVKKEGEDEKPTYSCEVLRFKRAAQNWPTDYRVYSTFDAVVVPPALYHAFPPDVREALQDYTLLGGAVLVTPLDSASGGLDGDQAAASRFITAISHAKELLNGHSGKELSPSAPLAKILLKVDATPNVSFLAFLLALFACAGVPYVMLRCRKQNRRLAALWMLPAASFALALIIAICALVFYGTTPTERLQSVTRLDQTTRRAFTRGQFAVFTPTSAACALRFPLDSTFSLWMNRDDSLNAAATISDAYHLTGDWVKPLTPGFFGFQRIARRSEKLAVRAVGPNELQLVNLLGAPIKNGCLQFKEHLYSFGTIAPGQTITCQGVPSKPAVGPTVLPQTPLFGRSMAFGCDWPRLVGLSKNPSPPLPDAMYFVVLDGSPFFPSPFGEQRTHASRESIVVGTFAEETK